MISIPQIDSINNKISCNMLKQIENHSCKDITVNNKYDLDNQPIINPKQRKRRNINENDSTDIKICNFNNFNIISTLLYSIKLVV